MSDIYYSPESYGLRTVGHVQWGPASYDFDITAVWRDDDGRFYVASDSGCSCPSPFQSVDRRTLAPMTAHEAVAALNERLAAYVADNEDEWGDGPAECDNARNDVARIAERILTGASE